MIKEAINRILELDRGIIQQDIGGRIYTNKELRRLEHPNEYTPTQRKFETLEGLAMFVKDFKPPVDVDLENLFFHVESPSQVSLCGQLQHDNFNKRFVYATASMELEKFKFSSGGKPQLYDLEMFVIALQSLFVPNEDLDIIIDNACGVSSENVATNNDDRMSQTIELRTGIVTKSKVKVKNPVKLRPFRTFREVDQPESSFILRWHNAKPMCASLWEGDGGAWRGVAMKSIKDWLEFETVLKALA
jgi:hypothetical protein